MPSPQGYGWSIEDGQFVPDKCEILMQQNPCPDWLSARASKADVSRHVDGCQKTFRAQMCAYKSDEDNCDNVFSNSGNSSNTDSSDNEVA